MAPDARQPWEVFGQRPAPLANLFRAETKRPDQPDPAPAPADATPAPATPAEATPAEATPAETAHAEEPEPAPGSDLSR